NGKISQRKVCVPLISSTCIDIRSKLLRLTDFATVNLEETNDEPTRKYFERLTDGDVVCATERAATIVQGLAQEAAEGLDGRRYAFVNGYETNYIVDGMSNRCGEYFYKFEHRREKQTSERRLMPRRPIFAIVLCKSAPHRTHIYTCQRVDGCGCCLPPNTRIREGSVGQARNARIGTIGGLERDWAADVSCYCNHRPDNVDVVAVVVAVVVVDSGGGGDGDAFGTFAESQTSS
ncbi:hypothetical protein ALC62_12138, partial [Cyphomyrmex costatus]